MEADGAIGEVREERFINLVTTLLIDAYCIKSKCKSLDKLCLLQYKKYFKNI